MTTRNLIPAILTSAFSRRFKAYGLSHLACVIASIIAPTSAEADTTMLEPKPITVSNREMPTTPSVARLSPDGLTLYVSDITRDELFVLSEEPSSGGLTIIERETDGIAPGGLSQNARFTVSPDGRHFYLVNRDNDSLSVYERDVATGELSFIDAEFQGVDGVQGLAFSYDVLTSREGEHVYVAGSPGLMVLFERDLATGTLAFVEAESGIVGGKAVLAADGRQIYVLNGNGVGVFHRDTVTGRLTYDPSLTLSQDLTDHIVMSPDDLTIYISSGTGLLGIYARDVGTGALTLVQGLFAGRGQVVISPDGAHVYLGDSSGVKLFSREAGTGVLTLLEHFENGVDGIHGLDSNLVFSPDGSIAYAMRAGQGSISTFSRDSVDGRLTFERGLFAFRSGRFGTITPDGRHAYVASSTEHGVGVFARDSATGGLALLEIELDDYAGAAGLRGAVAVDTSPGDEHLYVASPEDDAIAVFARNGETGEIDFVEAETDGTGGVAGIDGVTLIQVSPEGSNVYAVSPSALVVFARDASSGQLSFVEAEVQGGGAGALAASPDGAHVYAGGFNGLAAFQRNPADGSLSFIETMVEGQGARGLADIASIAPTADGRFVYVAGSTTMARTGAGSVAVFSRDATTGRLSFVEVEVHGSGGAFELDGPKAIAFDPSELHLYVAAASLNVFRRDPISGHLALAQDISLASPNSIATTADGAGIYVWGSAWVRLFSPGFSCAEDPLVGCRTSSGARMTLVDHPADGKDNFSWSWRDGAATDPTEFDPGTENHFILCGYDESGVSPPLVFSALISADQDCRRGLDADPKSCWGISTSGSSSLKDRFRTPDGLKTLILEPGEDGEAQISASGSGVNLHPPTLPLGLPFRLQLQSVEGLCWESTFSSPSRNDGLRFTAKGD